MLIRLFGIFGLILASGYFIEGLTLILLIFRALRNRDAETLVYRFVVMSLDLFTALALVIAAVGLLFAQRWARKIWLITMSILTVLHFLLVVLSHLGTGVSTVYLSWSWTVILLTALSWWYFSKTSTNVVQPESDQLPQNADTAPE